MDLSSLPAALDGPVNIAWHLHAMAAQQPHTLAVVVPEGRNRAGRVRYSHLTYRQLDEDSDRIASGLAGSGIGPETRAAVMVRPGLDFFALVFALFKAGVVPVLIDPGMGLKSLGGCLREAAPELFIGIPALLSPGGLLGWGRASVRRVIAVAPGRRRSGFETLDDLRRAGQRALEAGVVTAPVFRPIAPDEHGGDPLHQRQHGPAQGGRLHARDLPGAGRAVPRRSTRSSPARSISARFRSSPSSPPRWG